MPSERGWPPRLGEAGGGRSTAGGQRGCGVPPAPPAPCPPSVPQPGRPWRKGERGSCLEAPGALPGFPAPSMSTDDGTRGRGGAAGLPVVPGGSSFVPSPRQPRTTHALCAHSLLASFPTTAAGCSFRLCHPPHCLLAVGMGPAQPSFPLQPPSPLTG